MRKAPHSDNWKMQAEGHYFVSLGAGINQVPLILSAQELGFRTIAVDQNLQAPGFEFATVQIHESIFNYRKVLYKLSMAVDTQDIAGIYSASYAHALLSASYIAEHLKLRGIPRTTMESILDKSQVREFLSVAPIPEISQPRYLKALSGMLKTDIESLGFPLIVKARSGAGKHAVFEADKFSSLKEILSRKNLSEQQLEANSFMLEEKIQGDEIIVTGLVENFEFYLITITDKIHSPIPPFIDIEHRYPSAYESLAQKILTGMQSLVKIMQIPAGPIVAEFIIKDQNLFLIEISPQVPGELIGEYVIPAAAGINLYTEIVRVFTGLPTTLPKKRKLKPMKQIRVEYIIENPGIVAWENMLGNAFAGRVFNPSPVNPPRSNADRFGALVFVENI